MGVRRRSRIKKSGVTDQVGAPILLVEDMRSVAGAFSSLLRQSLGCEVHVAHNLAEARALLSGGHHYPVALCDLNLPDARRGEIIDVVMAAGIPTIAITAAFGEEFRDDILQRGVMDYVLKDGFDAYAQVCNAILRLLANRGIRVLVVDGDTETREALHHMLGRYGLKVIQATNGTEGLKALHNHPDIRLMLVDDRIPPVDGVSFTHAVRNTHGKDRLAILGMSESPDPVTSARFLKRGANDFLRKPLHFEELICRVHQHLEMLALVEVNLRAATQDFLTNLYNRRHFFTEGQERLERLGGKGCTAVMLDIDHFKRINDSCGHDRGDEVLRTVAACLNRHFHAERPARIGGEEFAILISGQPLEGIKATVQALLSDVSSIAFECNGQAHPLSLSAGIAPVGEGGLDAAMCEADRLLYQAKAAGRNRIAYPHGNTFQIERKNDKEIK